MKTVNTKSNAKKYRRLIIENRAGVDDHTALQLVAGVIRQGRISETRQVKHYSHASTFSTQENACELVVYSLKSRGGSDRFVVLQA